MEPVLARVAQTVVPWDAAPQAQTSDTAFCGIGEECYEKEEETAEDSTRMGPEIEATDDAVCLLETDLDNPNCTLRRRRYPKRVEICVVFLKVGEIDTIKEQFTADVLVKAKWREPSLDKSAKDAKDTKDQRASTVDPDSIWHPRLFIENTIGEPKESIFRSPMWMENGDAYMTEKRRVKGTFLENLELMDFPFDVQDLTCTVASDRPQTEVELASDANDIHRVNKQSFVDEQEWSLYKHIEAESRVLTYEHADPTFQRQALSVKCRAARRPAYFFWNIFLITFLICSLSFATFSVGYDKPQNRLQLSFTLILTSVAFKFIVNQSLPKISYLTYLDKYVLASMIMLALICVWHSLVTVIGDYAPELSDTPKEFMKKVEKGMVWTLLSLYFMYNVSFAVRIYFSACRRRRIMKQKDKEYSEKIIKLEQKVKKRKFFRRQSSREVPRNEHVIVNTTTDSTWL